MNILGQADIGCNINQFGIGGLSYMKKAKLHITFHNPNTRNDSERIAGEFISQAATGVLTRMILDKMGKHSENKTYESYSDWIRNT